MSLTRVHPLRLRARPRRTMFTAVVAVSLLLSSLVTAAPANAAYAHYTGWHRVCADSLKQYNNGYVQTLGWTDEYYITHFAGSSHVWGYGFKRGGSGGQYGWVYNGWFC